MGLGKHHSKGSRGEEIPAKLFQVLKDVAVEVLHSICQHTWKTQQGPQDWKRSVFIPISKKGNAKECSNYHTIALIAEGPADKAQQPQWAAASQGVCPAATPVILSFY